MAIYDYAASFHAKAVGWQREYAAAKRADDKKDVAHEAAEELRKGVTHPTALGVGLAVAHLAAEMEMSDEWRASGRPAWDVREPAVSLTGLPEGSWFLEVPFQLQTELISKDDAPFTAIENTIKKDRVSGVPEYWGPSWKGILRRAFSMRFGDESASGGFSLKGVQAERDRRLFGNPKTERKDFQSGRLRFFTTRFSKIGFAVIHPSRRKVGKAGAPIFHEVVSAKAEGNFRLLHCPWDSAGRDRDSIAADSEAIAQAIRLMFELGIGAKSSSGFGTAIVKRGGSCKAVGTGFADLQTLLPKVVRGEA
jgi:CRISPR/Cas system CSM-associated protein Csm3 (group 7 of RAMP superfamily)